MPQPHRRPLEDFFKPYGRTVPLVPQKRQSPSSTDKDHEPHVTKKPAPKTPAKSVSFKNVTPQSQRTLQWSPLSQSSLPIRSPRPRNDVSPTTSRQTSVRQSSRASPTREVKQSSSFAFSDTSERSQKVIEDGKVVAVRDSDDDTDSLESLDDILARRNVGNASDSSPPEEKEAEATKTLRTTNFGRSAPIVEKDKVRKLYAKDRAIRFDIGGILDDHFGDEEAQQNISKMREELSRLNDTDEEEDIDRGLLKSVILEEEDDNEVVGRLLHAVERTEALSADKSFTFFDYDRQRERKPSRRAQFPPASIANGIWPAKDIKAQDRAFLSGYVAEEIASGGLSDESISWIVSQIAYELRPELRTAYTKCIQACSRQRIHTCLRASVVNDMFQNLGAKEDCLSGPSRIESRCQPLQECSTRDYSKLVSVLSLFEQVCDRMEQSALFSLASITLRLLVDKSVMSSNIASVVVERLLTKLLTLPDPEIKTNIYKHFVADASSNLRDPQLQVQLLSHILPTTRSSVILRKALSHIFLFGHTPSTIKPTMQRDDDATLEQLSQYVSKVPDFSVTRHTRSPAVDYAVLTARVQILSIAVSSCTKPLTRSSIPQPLVVPKDSQQRQRHEEAVKFDASVDALADFLHDLFVSIKDTGASHMRRTEAKDALQVLHFQLLYSLRTKPRRKKHIFDPAGGSNAAGGQALKGKKGSQWITREEYEDRVKGKDAMRRFVGGITKDGGEP